MKKKPFAKSSPSEQAISAKHLANQLLFRLYNHGCKLLVSTELSQFTIRGTWILHREQTVACHVGFACIGISDEDKLQFIDFPENLYAVLEDVIEKNWPKKIQKTKRVGEMLEVKLKGHPWLGLGGEENVQSKSLIKALINELLHRQWVLYGSSNLRGNADTIFFKYDPNMADDTPFKVGFMLSLNREDRLRLNDAPPEVIETVRATVTDNPEHRLKKEEEKFGSYEFKVSGAPWAGLVDCPVTSRTLLCKIFERLVAIGWRVQLGIDLTKKKSDKSVFSFVRCAPNPFNILCVSLNSSNKIRLINFPEYLLDPFLAEVDKKWQFNVRRLEEYYGAPEIKLHGNPWRCDLIGHDNAHGGVLITYIIKMLASMGWFLIVSADVSSRIVSDSDDSDYPHDVDSFWFMQLCSAPPSVPPSTPLSTLSSVPPSAP